MKRMRLKEPAPKGRAAPAGLLTHHSQLCLYALSLLVSVLACLAWPLQRLRAEESRPANANQKQGKLPLQLNPVDGAEMVFIAGGEFTMGSAGGPPDERPPHLVLLKGYWIYRTEVTCDQYAKFLTATRYDRSFRKKSFYADPKRSPLPATDVSWLDAQEYCRWAAVRLPTEAEWEKAARGPEGLSFPYGTTFDPMQANIFSGGLKEVGSYPPHGYDLFDMSGNVWEWCSDWYSPSYYPKSPENNPTGPMAGCEKVLRGGSWTNMPEYGTATFRYRYFPSSRSPVYGFRCVKDE